MRVKKLYYTYLSSTIFFVLITVCFLVNVAPLFLNTILIFFERDQFDAGKNEEINADPIVLFSGNYKSVLLQSVYNSGSGSMLSSLEGPFSMVSGGYRIDEFKIGLEGDYAHVIKYISYLEDSLPVFKIRSLEIDKERSVLHTRLNIMVIAKL